MAKKLICLIMCLAMLASFAALPANAAENPFNDVPQGKWFTEAVLWCYENGYFAGTTATTFSPNMVFSRAQFVTVLAQIEGVDKTAYAGKSVFTDVPENTYYTAPVNWAKSAGVVSGKSATTFAPNDPVTRQEACVIFVAYLNYKGLTLNETSPEPNYKDWSSVAAWARDAVTACTKYGLVAGNDKGNFDPKGSCLRSMAAVMIMNFVKAMDAAYDPIVVAYYNYNISSYRGDLEYVDVMNYNPFSNNNNSPYIKGSINANSFTKAKNQIYKINPDIKIVFTFAITNYLSSGFESSCLGNKTNREKLGNEMIEFVRTYDFDGIDIDYEFPSEPYPYRDDFVELCRYLREKLDALSEETEKDYTLTLAIPGSTWAFSLFDIKALCEYVDWFNIMSYDNFVSRGVTVHHTAPYDNSIFPGNGSIASDIKLFTSRGVPASKIVPGCGLYSHKWTDVEPGENGDGLFQPGKHVTTGNDTNIYYSSLLSEYIGSEGTGINGYTRYWDDVSKAPYLYNPTTRIFLSYDDEESVSYKVDLVKQNKVRGVMVFDYGTCQATGFFPALGSMIDGTYSR